MDGNLTVDGYDKKKKIRFEFVSADDFVNWKAKQKCSSTVVSYNVLKAAEVLQKGLTKKNDGNTIGVFYDPMPSPVRKVNEEDKLRQEAIEDLRAQVKDFLNWVKAEGII